MNRKILGIGILLVFLLSVCVHPVAADKIKTNEELAKDRLKELKALDKVVRQDKNLKNKAFSSKLVDVNNEITAYADMDASTIIVKKDSDNKIRMKDIVGGHKLRDIKLLYSDVAETPGFENNKVLISHYDDLGFRDAQWVQEVENVGGYVYLSGIPFSEVVIGGVVGKYIKSGKMVYQDSNFFGLGATFEPDKINSISATVTPDIVESGPYDIPTDGLVGFWKCDEDSGDNITDYSGLGNNLSGSSLLFEEGKFNNAVNITTLSTSPAVESESLSMDNYTIIVYVNVYNSSIKTERGILGKVGVNTDGKSSYNYALRSYQDSIQFEIYNGSIVMSTTVPFSEYDKYIMVTAKKDGNLMSENINIGTTYSAIIPDDFNIENDGAFRIGSKTTLPGTNLLIDTVIVYSRALTDSEIEQIYYDSLDNLTIQSNSVPSDTTAGGTVSVPFSGAGADISTLTASVPTNTTIDNVTVRYYNETVTPVNITAEVSYTENTTIISEELTSEYYRVYITHIPGNDYVSGFVNYTSDSNDILDSPFLQTSISTNNENATYTLSTYDWSITTGPITAGTTYNYVLTAYLEGTVIDDTDRNGIGYTGLGAYEAEGNETTIIGSRFTAYSAKESEWGSNGSDVYVPASAIIGVVTLIILFGYTIKGLTGIGRKK